MISIEIQPEENFRFPDEEYQEVENYILFKLRMDKERDMLIAIKQHRNIIDRHFEKEENVKDFVKKFNDIIVEHGILDFRFNSATGLVNNDAFRKVREEIKKSDLFARLVKTDNMDGIRWVLKNKLENLFIYYEDGTTPLMYIAKYWKYYGSPLLDYDTSLLAYVIEHHRDALYLTDREGNTALYHSVRDFKNFSMLFSVTKDINHLNNKNESVILYCARNEAFLPFNRIIDQFGSEIYVNGEIFYNEGKVELLRAFKNNKFNVIRYLIDQYRTLSNYTNINILRKINDEIGESVLELIVKYYYKAYSTGNDELYIKFIRLLKIAISDLECDVNCPVDSDENTLIMFLLIIEDYQAVNYLLTFKGIDLSIKNKFGIDASFLSLFVKDKKLKARLMDYPTFKINDNILLEAIKSGYSDSLEEIFFKNEYKNKQDYSGSTPLHYAVKLKDKYALIQLAFYGADTTIKNNKGQTAIDLANEIGDEEIIDMINHPLDVLKSFKSKSSSIFSKLKRGSSSASGSSSRKNEAEFIKLLHKNKHHLMPSKSSSNPQTDYYNNYFGIGALRETYPLSDKGRALFKRKKNAFLLSKIQQFH